MWSISILFGSDICVGLCKPSSVVCPGVLSLAEESEEGTCSDGRADDTGHVGTHGVHEEEVVAVVLESEVVGDARAHGHGTHTGVTDERIDFLVARQEEVHQFDKQNAAGGGYDEGAGTDEEDEDAKT